MMRCRGVAVPGVGLTLYPLQIRSVVLDGSIGSSDIVLGNKSTRLCWAFNYAFVYFIIGCIGIGRMIEVDE